MTAIFVVLCNALIIYLFKKNDNELCEKMNNTYIYRMYVFSFVAGLIIGDMPEPLNNIFCNMHSMSDYRYRFDSKL